VSQAGTHLYWVLEPRNFFATVSHDKKVRSETRTRGASIRIYFSSGIAGGHASQAGTHLYWVLGPSIFLVYFVRSCNRRILEASPVPLAFFFSTQVVDSILAPGGTKDLSIGWNTPYSSMLLNSTAVIHQRATYT
jgi:hypothetical protein